MVPAQAIGDGVVHGGEAPEIEVRGGGRDAVANEVNLSAVYAWRAAATGRVPAPEESPAEWGFPAWAMPAAGQEWPRIPNRAPRNTPKTMKMSSSANMTAMSIPMYLQKDFCLDRASSIAAPPTAGMRPMALAYL